MGSSCCCFGVADIDALANENSSNHQGNCQCVCRCLQDLVNKLAGYSFQEDLPSMTRLLYQLKGKEDPKYIDDKTHIGNRGKFLSKYHVLFGRGNPVPTSDQQAAPSHEGADDRSSYRTLSNDQNPRYSLVPGDDAIREQDRGSSRSRVQPEPFSEAVQQQPKSLKMEDKLVQAYKGGESKECCSDSSLKLKGGVEYFFPTEEDEDVCPTCLEEYTEENPKILTHCAHHYHLSCIYEWMERNETCPVCGKLMEFDE